MVRVISVHHFESQDVATVSTPMASTSTPDNKLLVATENLLVEVRDLKNCGQLTHSFQTIDLVCELVHSAIGNYVATLEGSRGSKGASVRVYVNWSDPKVEGASLRPRIATRVTPSMQSQEVTLDMIEFPQRDTPLQIAVCPSTGNLIVAALNVMVIYKYVLKTQETSKFKYVDFEDCVHIFHNFIPKEIALVESIVSCLSDSEVHVFRLKLYECDDDERQMRSISVYSLSSESESSSFERTCRRDSEDSEGTPSSTENELKKVKVNVTAKRQQDSEGNDNFVDGCSGSVRRHPDCVDFGQAEVTNAKKILLPDIEKADKEFLSIGPPKIMDQTLGPCSPSVGFRGSSGDIIVKVVPTTVQEQSVEGEAITLVHCKLLPSEEQHEKFQNLILKPVYWREMRVRKKEAIHSHYRNGQGPCHPLHSPHHAHMMALSLCFTSNNEGFLYHLPGHLRKIGKGCGVQRIATYPFTSPVSKIALEPTLLHALTQTGLETYTLRSGYSTVQEAEIINNRTNACPSSHTPICLVGLRPFLGARNLLVADNYLVLLATGEDDQMFGGTRTSETEEPTFFDHKKWTIYSLKLPTPMTLYKDMIELANMNRALSPQGYQQLFCEAHMVLRTAYHQLSWIQGLCQTEANEEELLKTRQSYLVNCLQLANLYVLADTKKEWELALPYYRMSQEPALNILIQAKNLWKKHCEEENLLMTRLPPGLIRYIEEIILRPCTSEDVLEASLADLIIDLLGEYCLDVLAKVLLKSNNFRQFKATKMFNYLKQSVVNKPRPGGEEVVAFSLICVERCAGEEARGPLQALSPIQLSETVLEHYHFLLDEVASGGEISDTFSDFALLLRDTVPETFVEILVSLIRGVNSQGSSVDLSAHHTSTLQLFLEAYFTDILSDPDSGFELSEGEVRALHTLIRSYLTGLSVPVRFGEKNIDSNMFGVRPMFLDLLPPFDCSSDPAEKAILNTDSPDFWCQNCLLKLQSLLVSNLCKGSEVSVSSRLIVADYLAMRPDTIGADGLMLLCVLNDNQKSIKHLVEHQPSTILNFAKERQFGLKDWKDVLQCLQDQVNHSPCEHRLHEVWYNTMQEILEHLAQTLLLEAFLDILPHPKNSDDFQAYIQICRKNQQAHKIQKLIVSTGHDMLNRLSQAV